MSWTFVLGMICLLFIIFIACIVIVSYGFLFFCKKTMNDYAIFFNDYNPQSKIIIEKYGDCKITRAYVVITPIANFTFFILNVLTLQNCKHIIHDTMHVRLLIECKTKECETKMIMINKTSCINVTTDYQINDDCQIIPIKLKKKTTLRGILDETCARIGKLKFFNWHMYKNNCHYFTKELIYQINNEFNCKHFISKKKIKHSCHKMFYNNFILNLYHILMFLYNFIQKYVINVIHHIVSKLEHIINGKKASHV